MLCSLFNTAYDGSVTFVIEMASLKLKLGRPTQGLKVPIAQTSPQGCGTRQTSLSFAFHCDGSSSTPSVPATWQAANYWCPGSSGSPRSNTTPLLDYNRRIIILQSIPQSLECQYKYMLTTTVRTLHTVVHNMLSNYELSHPLFNFLLGFWKSLNHNVRLTGELCKLLTRIFSILYIRHNLDPMWFSKEAKETIINLR